MKNFIAAAVFIFLLSFSVFAQKSDSQTNPGFEGTWVLDDSNFSNPFGGRNKIYGDETLTISQNNNEVKIVKNYKFKDQPMSSEMVLFLDKRGEENLMPFGGNRKFNIRSESYSKENSIIREYKLVFMGHISQQREIYKLSDDGKTLTVRLVDIRDTFPSLSDPEARPETRRITQDTISRLTYRKEG
jgi:hypothetical protein